MLGFDISTFGMGGDAQGASRRRVQNIASRGQVHNATIAASGGRTRMKGISRFTIGHGGAKSLQPVFSNFRLNNAMAREVDGPAYTIRKAAISYEGVTVPLFFDGSRSITLAAGAAVVMPDALTPAQFGVERFRPGYVAFVRMCLDLPGGAIPAQGNPMYAGGESQLLYNPANDIDDIDATTWAEPAGSEQWIAFPHPVMMAGVADQPMTSLAGIGDSILDGSVDNSGDGAGGGGWLRRAAFIENLPFLAITRTGDKAQFVAASNAKTQHLMRAAGVHAAIVALGNNDIRDGRSHAQIMGDLRSIWTWLRTCGASWLGQSLVLSETTSTDQSSSLTGQAVKATSGAGSARELVNGSIAALDGGNLDDWLDIASPVQSLGKWDVPAFEAVLASAANAWSGQVSLSRAPEIGDFLVFEPGTPASQDANWPHVSGVSGSGPFTVTLTGGPTKAHASGTAVRSSLSADGIHPQQVAHRRIALKAAPAMRRAKAIRTSWIDTTKSFEIDFINRRAQRGGIALPVESLVSCARASTGKAFDGFSWLDIAANQLRYADGGGLFIEPTRTNEIRNSTMAGGLAPATKPNLWNFNVPAGITVASYAFGTENGIRFVDVRFTGSLTGSGGISIDPDNSIPVATGDVWNHSMFLAILQNTGATPGSMTLGGRVGSSGGAGLEFPSSPNLISALSRKMTRQSYGFTVTAAAAFTINPRFGINFTGAVTVDLTMRLGSPQFERSLVASSPVDTSGTAFTRANDAVTITLPVGSQNLTITFDDGSSQAISGVSGSTSLPALNRTIIHRISGAASGS